MSPRSAAKDGWTTLLPGMFVLLWSTGFIGAKLGLPYAEPMTFLALRFAIAGSLLLALLSLQALAERNAPAAALLIC